MTSKRVSSVSKSRIYTMYVDRNTQVNNIQRISSIDRINKTANESFHNSDNVLLGTSNFYDSLKKLKEQYLTFYKVEKELEDALEEFTHREDPDQIKIIENLIQKYNHAIDSLKALDSYLGTNHCKNIHDILLVYRGSMNKIGIIIDRDYHLSLQKQKLIQAVKINNQSIEFLFNTKNGLVRKLYNAFRDIKIPSSHHGKYNLNHSSSTSIIDKKL
ncbi:hypothetical protein HNQ80_005152 [Anaerosolibacter carboniphilus]|uniref:Uncharacterized protein n=1 Tax=Anaerosolibacter carboniphilus TaxID=1417629 RepID=A0A841KZC5_9FIRM|nr:hypothetical protein [Anaerosolibacter carboniphilus]MBB6218974.1 hypothetical protein [Anaerosolibacter carboniphilus]